MFGLARPSEHAYKGSRATVISGVVAGTPRPRTRLRRFADRLVHWALVWGERLITGVFAAFMMGIALVYFGVIAYAVIWGLVSLARGVFEHVAHAVATTDRDLLGRNLALGTAIAALTATWLAVRWRRTHPEWPRRGRGTAWVSMFALVWGVLFVGGEAAGWQPTSPATRPMNASAAGSVRSSSSGSGLLSTDPSSAPSQSFSAPPSLGGGTLCSDGWLSPSTGRGTCSSHGGIAGGAPSAGGSRSGSTSRGGGSGLAGGSAPQALPTLASALTGGLQPPAMIAASPTPTLTAAAIAQPNPSASPTPKVGGVAAVNTRTVYVANTNGVGVYLRGSPHLSDRLHAVSEGTALTAVDSEPIESDGMTWVVIRDAGGEEAYVLSQYVSDQAPMPTPTAAATSRPIATATTSANAAPRRTPTPTPQPAPLVTPGSITIGSTTDDVLARLGAPTGRYPSYWQYGLATINFADGRVVGWSNADARPHLHRFA